ncbi:hypothetical protein BH10BAC5_BH10BAC5_08180 [soil metagenome]
MKGIKILVYILFLTSLSNSINAQDIYHKYKETDTKGDRLYLYASDLLSAFQYDSTFKGIRVITAARFTHWHFNKHLQSAGYTCF